MVFREVQWLRKGLPWLWFIILGTSLLFCYLAYEQFIKGEPVGNNPAPDWVFFILLVVIGIGLPLLFFFSRMITEIRGDGLYVRFIPCHFSFKCFGFNEIESAEATKYRPIRDFGGWGIRYGRAGKAYT